MAKLIDLRPQWTIQA